MSTPFQGFAPQKTRLTPVPNQFFHELLPSIDNLEELKVSLYILWRLDQQEGNIRFCTLKDILEDERFLSGMGRTPKEAAANTKVALEKAVIRGVVLTANINDPHTKSLSNSDKDTFFFLNSPRGRAAVQGLQKGKWHPSQQAHLEVTLEHERPNIFQLYETHIGPLTPMIAETLRDAEETYQAEWIEDAIRIAVENNVRRWRYVAAILESWTEKGRDDRKDRRDTEEDRRQYFKELADQLGE